MDENVKKRNECLAQTVIKGLQSRNIRLLCPKQRSCLKTGIRADPTGKQYCHGRLHECPRDWTYQSP